MEDVKLKTLFLSSSSLSLVRKTCHVLANDEEKEKKT
jgi:hypothetical protein